MKELPSLGRVASRESRPKQIPLTNSLHLCPKHGGIYFVFGKAPWWVWLDSWDVIGSSKENEVLLFSQENQYIIRLEGPVCQDSLVGSRGSKRDGDNFNSVHCRTLSSRALRGAASGSDSITHFGTGFLTLPPVTVMCTYQQAREMKPFQKSQRVCGILREWIF
jgi:hypothetical protein